MIRGQGDIRFQPELGAQSFSIYMHATRFITIIRVKKIDKAHDEVLSASTDPMIDRPRIALVLLQSPLLRNHQPCHIIVAMAQQEVRRGQHGLPNSKEGLTMWVTPDGRGLWVQQPQTLIRILRTAARRDDLCPTDVATTRLMVV